jgi:WD40 repeat protein
MRQDDDFLTPEALDEQIERLSIEADTLSPSTRLVHDLHSTYEPYATKDARSVEQVWERLVHSDNAMLSRQDENIQPIDIQKYRQERSHNMITTTRSVSRWRTLQQRIGIVAAILFLTLLVGSMIVVLNNAHQGATQTGSGYHPAIPVAKQPTVANRATTTPPLAQGKTLYSYHTIDNIYSLAWSPNSARIAMGTDTVVREWDATSGKNVFTYNPNPKGGASVLSVAWSPDGQRIADGSGNAQIWNAKTGHLYITFPSSQQLGAIQQPTNNAYLSSHVSTTPFSGGSVIYSTAWSPNGKYMASALDGGYGNIVDVWDTSTGKVITTYRGHTDYVSQVAWSPDGKYVASSSYDSTVQVWNASTGKSLVTYKGHSSGVSAVAWSPDGKLIASASGDGTVQLWNPLTGQTSLTYRGHTGGVDAVAWSPDGTRIASGGADTTVKIWDATTGKTLYTYHGHSNNVRTLAWSPNGKYITSAEDSETGGGTVKVWVA